MPDIYDVICNQLFAHQATKIFDVGCGNGKLGLRLKKLKFNGVYKGLDRDPCAIEALSKRKLQGEEGDLRWYDGMKFYWDTIVVKDALEEFYSPTLLVKAFSMSRRLFILATRAPVYDCLMSPVLDKPSFKIDDLLFTAQSCSFGLAHFEQFGDHSVMVFLRRKKQK